MRAVITGSRERSDNMKATKYFLALAAAALLLGASTVVLAQGSGANPAPARPAIVDANNDGICDLTGRIIGSGNPGNGPGNGNRAGVQAGKRMGPQDCTQPRLGQGSGAGNGGWGMGGGRRGGRR